MRSFLYRFYVIPGCRLHIFSIEAEDNALDWCRFGLLPARRAKITCSAFWVIL